MILLDFMPAGRRGESLSRMDWIMGIGNHDTLPPYTTFETHFLFTTAPSHMLIREVILKARWSAILDQMMWELKEMLLLIHFR